MQGDALNMAVGCEFACEYCETFHRCIEVALVENGRADVRADIHDLGFHEPLAERHEIKAAEVCECHHNRRCDQHRLRQLHAAVARCGHNDEFAFGIHPVQPIERAAEEGDG